MPRPSPLQHHRRLNSIENDDWSERFDESDEHSEGSESSHDRIATEQHKNGKDKHVRRTGDRTLQHTRALTRDADT